MKRLTQDELMARGGVLAALWHERQTIAAEAQAMAKEYRQRLEGITERIDRLSDELRTGTAHGEQGELVFDEQTGELR